MIIVFFCLTKTKAYINFVSAKAKIKLLNNNIKKTIDYGNKIFQV